jgi:hypothetical protein
MALSHKSVAVFRETKAVRGRASVRAFNAGVLRESGRFDLITNLDADVSFEPTYFDVLRQEFERNPGLGIASGLCHELQGDCWRPVYVTYPNLRGASRTYRGECLTQLLPLEERLGWAALTLSGQTFAVGRLRRSGLSGTSITVRPVLETRAGSRAGPKRATSPTTCGIGLPTLRTLYRVTADRDLAAAVSRGAIPARL